MILNRPTPEGEELGRELVRLIEPDVKRLEAEGVPDARCSSCAFRLGTIPNGCPTTLMDALKCIMEGDPFYCHMGDKPLCHGWLTSRANTPGESRPAPWDFTGGVDSRPRADAGSAGTAPDA